MTPIARIPRPARLGAAFAALAAGLLLPAAALASIAAGVALNVHWAPSPPADAQGNPLPPAAAYEIWVTADAQPESMVATVADTQHVLMLPAGSTCVVRVRAVAADGTRSSFSEPSDPVQVDPGASPAGPVRTPAWVGPALPNPFNARTAITYRVPDGLAAADPLGLEIFDLRGRQVDSIALDRSPGEHRAAWDGRDRHGRRLPSGMYVARYRCGAYEATLRLTLVA